MMWSLIISKYGSTVQKVIILSLISLGFLVATLGLQYTSVRYVVVPIVIFIFLFNLKLWEYVWKISLIQKHFCPNLSGKWKGTLKARYKLPDDDEVQERHVRVDFDIKMSFLTFKMTGVSENNYMKSEVISSWLKTEEGNLYLYYNYKVCVKDPLPTDEQFFHGSARLELLWNDYEYHFEGNYWTNRKWNIGGQTAGHIKLERL